MATAVIKTYPRKGDPKVFPYKSVEEAKTAFGRIKRSDPKAELITGPAALDAIMQYPDPMGEGLTAVRTDTGVRTLRVESAMVPLQPDPRPTKSLGLRITR